MNRKLNYAIRTARAVARTDLRAAVRMLQTAGVPFKTACRFALHCARSAR